MGRDATMVGRMSWNTLSDVLATRAAAHGGTLAYDDGRDAITFGDLAERAAARAEAMTHDGVRRGDRVAIAMAAGIPFAEVFWALQALGAVPCAVNPHLTEAAFARRIALLRPRLVVDDAAAAAMVTATRAAIPGPAGAEPEDLAFVQLTSGTSGEPRGALVTQRNVLAMLASFAEQGHVVPGDVMVAWVPPWHDLGLVRFVIGAVYHAAPCHIVAPAIATIPTWLQKISQVGATVSGAPDFAYRLATRMVDPASVDLGTLRDMSNGGEPVRWSTIEAFERRFGVPGVVLPGYGLAEATLGVAGHLPGEPIPVDERGNVSCGRPLPGFDMRAGASWAEPDEILVRGDAVFAGYLDAPDDTAERLRDGWLHTGDSGYVDREGRLYVLGRRAGMIKRAGTAVAPRELEEAAQRAPEVRIAAALGVHDAARDREVIVVVVEAVAAEEEGDRIAAEVSRHVVDVMGFAPDRVMVVAPRTIPRTENGKLRHALLRAAIETRG